MLQIDRVSRSFAGVEALRNVTLEIAEGEVVGLIGPNGSGKTTLFNVISGLFPADRGVIRFRGYNLAGLRPDQIAALGIARTFQTPRVFHRMTVWENLACAVFAGAPRTSTLGVDDRRHVEALLEKSGLDHRAGELAENLTLPEQRRLELVRTLVADPGLILLDEPAGGMTPAETEAMARLIEDVVPDGRSCIVIEHKIDMIASLCQRICVLDFGQVIADGNADTVLKDEAVLEAYLGRGKRA